MNRDALIVGINHYQQLSSLSTPATDAEAIAHTLETHGHFHITRLPQYPDPFADNAFRIAPQQTVTTAELEAALEQLFYPEGNSIPDTALFYFSGHGWQKPGRRGSEGFLVTSDADQSTRNWGLSLKWLRELLADSLIKQQVIWLDCCHAGELLNFEEANPGDWGEARDRSFLTASREFESVIEVAGMPHSTFTQAILRGFEQAPLANGWVTNETLVTFLRQELATAPQRFLPSNKGHIQLIARTDAVTLPLSAPSTVVEPEPDLPITTLANQLREWFETLGYKFEAHQVLEPMAAEWVVNIPVRRGYDRVLVRAIAGEAGIADFEVLQQTAERLQVNEGWLVAHRRITPACRAAREQEGNQHLFCYTFDELLDQTANFTGYLAWLEQEILQRGIAENYVPLACFKDEVDPVTQRKMGVSRYDEADGWIDGYVDRWLADPAKEHLSVLGEFGTGKTWFALHYAWTALQQYQAAKQRGVERPRLPLVIPLRDYAKAVSVESLFSEFFFRKHEIPLPGYSAFEQLNRMGKLLLIFDGFDEMAARINRQQMINNFWELAKTVVPGAKAILTCRTEHFPEAQEGRALLGAELQASTVHLSFETPRFEVLELATFEDEQIRRVLELKAQPETVERVMGNPELRDLARRPVMTELILEALPQIEAGKPVDISRVYLYAVRQKMERDIKAERTFTSLADKLYFLCELSWEMLSTDRMSLNYLEFPDRIRQLFSTTVQEEKDLDHWHHDMMGQTMLIRNAEGDYSPAHRSLLEFFVAYKLVAELGVLAPDFTEVAQAQFPLEAAAPAQPYTWLEYFQRHCGENGEPHPIAPLATFAPSSMERLLLTLKDSPLAKAVLDLAVPMLDPAIVRERLIAQIQQTRGHTRNQVGNLGRNLVQLLLQHNPYALEQQDLSETLLPGVNLVQASLRWVNLQGADLTNAAVPPFLASVSSVAFSPDGTQVVIGDRRGTIQILEVETGRILLFFQGHENLVSSVSFSPDGSRIVSGSYDNTVRLWDLDGQLVAAPFQDHKSFVMSVSFSPDGTQIASGSADKTVRLWDLVGQLVAEPFQGHESLVMSVSFSPDGTQIVSGSDDQTVRLWDLDGQLVAAPFQGHESGVRSVSFSPDGSRIVSGSDDKTVRLWDLDGQLMAEPFQGHESWVWSVSFSPDGSRIVSGSADKTVRLWDLDGHLVAKPFQGHESWVNSVSFSPDGTRIVSGSHDKTVRLWDLTGQLVAEPFQGHVSGVNSVSFSPDGTRIVSSSADQMVRLWDLAGQLVAEPFQGHASGVGSVSFSPDGTRIVSGSADQTVRLWDLAGQLVAEPFQGHASWISSVSFSPDGTRIVSGSADQTVRLWDLVGQLVANPFQGHEAGVRSVSFSPDGSRIVSGSDDNTVRLWNLAGQLVAEPFQGHASGVGSVSFSPDGMRIVSGSADQTVRLWDLVGQLVTEPFQGHEDWVSSVSFSPDGSRIVSGSDDKTVRLWDLAGQLLAEPFQGHEDWVRSVSFSPDGSRIVSGSADGTIRIWEVATGECVQVIDYRHCAGLRLTGALGLTGAQQTALRLMGAIDA